MCSFPFLRSTNICIIERSIRETIGLTGWSESASSLLAEWGSQVWLHWYKVCRNDTEGVVTWICRCWFSRVQGVLFIEQRVKYLCYYSLYLIILIGVCGHKHTLSGKKVSKAYTVISFVILPCHNVRAKLRKFSWQGLSEQTNGTKN